MATPQERLNALRARRKERERQAAELRNRRRAVSSGGLIARQIANQEQATLPAPQQPFIPTQQQELFRQSQEATEQSFLPLGVTATVGAQTAAPETAGRPEFGSGFGSGVAEALAGKGIAAASQLQKGLELFGGITTSLADFAPGQLFAGQNQGRGFAEILKEVSEESGRGKFFDAAGQAQNLAEAFRRTDMPSVRLNMIPGEGINLPGDAYLNEIDVGIKGAIEFVPDILLTAATGGMSGVVSGSARGLAKAVPTIAARTTGLDVLASGAKATVSGVRGIPSGISSVSSGAKKTKQTAAERMRPVHQRIGNLTILQGKTNIERAKIPEMRQMLNRLQSIKPVHGVISGVLHAVNPSMLLKSGSAATRSSYDKVVDSLYGRLNALSLVPGMVESNMSVFSLLMGGTKNAPALVDKGMEGVSQRRFDLGRQLGAGVGKVRDLTYGKFRPRTESGPAFRYDDKGRIVSEIEELNGRVWTDAMSSAFVVSKHGDLEIRGGKDAVIKGAAEELVAIDVNGNVIEVAENIEGPVSDLQQFHKYVHVDAQDVAAKGADVEPPLKQVEEATPIPKGSVTLTSSQLDRLSEVVTTRIDAGDAAVGAYDHIIPTKFGTTKTVKDADLLEVRNLAESALVIASEFGTKSAVNSMNRLLDKIDALPLVTPKASTPKPKITQGAGGEPRVTFTPNSAMKPKPPSPSFVAMMKADGKEVKQLDLYPKESRVIGEKGVENRIFHGTSLEYDPADIELRGDGIWLSGKKKVADRMATFGPSSAVMRDLEEAGLGLSKPRTVEYRIKDGAKIHVVEHWDGTNRTGIPEIDASRKGEPTLEDIVEAAGDADVIAMRSVRDIIGSEDAVYYLVRNPDVLVPPQPPSATAKALDTPGSFYESEASRFYTASRHNIETYQDMKMHYEYATGKKISETAVKRFTDAAYVPQVPKGGDWFEEVNEILNPKKPGQKGRPFKERSVAGDDLQEAIDKGHYEMAGPMEVMQSFMTHMYTTTIDAGLIKEINAATREIGSGFVNFNRLKGRVAKTINKFEKLVDKDDIKKLKPTSHLIKTLEAAGFEKLPAELQAIQSLPNAQVRKERIKKLQGIYDKEFRDLNGHWFALDDSAGRVAPAFAGVLFQNTEEVDKAIKAAKSKEGAKKIQKAAGLADPKTAGGIRERFAEVGDLLRVGKTGFDFGFHLIHGIPQLGLATGRFLAGHPKEAAKLYHQWGRSVKVTAEAFFRPEVLMETLMKEPEIVREAIENGLQLSRSSQDFFLATQNATILRRVPKAGEAMDNVLSDLARGFERAFVAPGDLLRIEGYRILKNTAGQSETGLTELAGFLNKMTGALDSSASGVARGQQQLERGFLFFSPRYTRSAMALLSDVYRGGTRGELARQTMVGMAFFGVATYWAYSRALGQEPKFDPTQSDFMTVQLGDSTVGIGGFWTQFTRLASKLAETAWDEDAQESFGDASENPLFRWVRSRAAPGAGAAWDIAIGEDYMGRQFSTLGDRTAHVGKQMMPIWMEALTLEDPYRTGPAGITAEILGSRTNPLSASKRRRILRDSIAEEAFGKKYQELNKLQQKQIQAGKAKGMTDEEVEKLQAFTDEVFRGNAARGEEVDINIEKWHFEREEIDKDWNDLVRTGIDHLQTEGSGIDLEHFRKHHLAAANAIRRDALDKLNDVNGDYALTMAYYTDMAEKFGEDHPEDVAYNEYIDTILATDDFDTPKGFDFKRRDDAVAAFRQRWGDEVYAYVIETLQTGRDLPVIVNEYYKGKEKFEYYWRDVEEQTLAAMPRAGELKEVYQAWLDADDNGKYELENQYFLLKKYKNLMSDVRLSLRRQDKLLDAWLFRWGFVTKLENAENRTAPDGYSNPREYWRQKEPFPFEVFDIGEGVNLPPIEQDVVGAGL